MLYRIQGSNNKKDWVTIEILNNYVNAIQSVTRYRNSGDPNPDFAYYRVRTARIADLVTHFFAALPKIFSYILKPITKQALVTAKAGDDSVNIYNNTFVEDLEPLKKYSTHVTRETRFVLGKMFPVVMRLFNSSSGYKNIIISSLDYMMEITTKKFEDYPAIKGISGANVGIPFNLVVLKVCEIDKDIPLDLEGCTTIYKGYHFLHMINPKIVGHSEEIFKPLTNCGSLQLDEEIRVKRYEWVTITFYGRDGNVHKIDIGRPLSGTVQHEIDHNNGILITDRAVKKTKKYNNQQQSD